ncbi:hypothetical protein Tco_0347970 [Tanacetum coccineum]
MGRNTNWEFTGCDILGRVHELEISFAGLQEKVTAYENCMEEKFYPHLLTTIAGRRWLLTYGMKLAIVKCLHFPDYLSALGAAISRAIEKGIQDGLAAGITHGQEGRVLTDIFWFNTSMEGDYISALQELQDVNFSLLFELKSNKDASTETLMNILRLDEPLTERLSLDESQPHVDQLDNIANHRSALHDVCVLLVEPLSSVALKGTEGTSGTAPETTMALSVTFASTSSIPPISTNDYDVVYADGQEEVILPILDLQYLLCILELILRSTSAVLIVGMPISAGMTASVSYVNKNGVSLLLDFIIVRCAHRT